MNKGSNACTAASPPMLISAKIRPTHQERLALVYVRQSSTKQVEENTESTEMQYCLVDRAAAMGWSDDRIDVIDDDLGMSGRTVENRVGFQRMIAEVSMGHVGIFELSAETRTLLRFSSVREHAVDSHRCESRTKAQTLVHEAVLGVVFPEYVSQFVKYRCE